MTAAYVSSVAVGVASSAGSVTVTKPTGTAVGDLLVAFCACNNTGAWSAPATPAWTAGPTGSGFALFTRVADGTEGASFVFTRSVTTGAGDVILVRVSGAGSVAASALAVGAGGVTTMALPSVTAAAANTLLLQLVTQLTTTAVTWTPPASAHERVGTGGAATSGTAISYDIGDELVPAGATGTRTWTHTLTQQCRGAILAITPAVTSTDAVIVAGPAGASAAGQAAGIITDTVIVAAPARASASAPVAEVSIGEAIVAAPATASASAAVAEVSIGEAITVAPAPATASTPAGDLHISEAVVASPATASASALVGEFVTAAYTLPPADRTSTVQAESRVLEVEFESRVLEVV